MSDYNGWKNYATWTVNILVSQDEFAQGIRNALLDAAIHRAPETSQVAEEIWTVEQAERYAAEDAIKDWIEGVVEMETDKFRTGLQSQFITAGMGQVDWQGLVKAWLSDHPREAVQA